MEHKKKEVLAIDAQIVELRAKARSLRNEIGVEVCPFSTGDVILNSKNKNTYKIKEIVAGFGFGFKIIGLKCKTNGEPGTRETEIHQFNQSLYSKVAL